MFIVTIKSIDADSFALPTLYGKTTLQNYNFSTNPQGVGCYFCFRLFFVGRGSHHLLACRRLACIIVGRGSHRLPIPLPPYEGGRLSSLRDLSCRCEAGIEIAR